MGIWQSRPDRIGPAGSAMRAKLKSLPAFGASQSKRGGRLPPFSRRVEPKIYGRVGNLQVRLARTRAEVKLAQRLRYQVFYEEMAAEPTRLAQFRRRDEDAFDPLCDHLLVVDLDEKQVRWRSGKKALPKVVGTYRVLRQDVAERNLGFYSQSEYDVAPLVAARSPRYRFVELGRSCVLAPYRGKRSVELLWHGLWTYIRENRVDVMIGCASFAGADPAEHAMALSYLYHHHSAPPEWSCRAHDHLHKPMNLFPRDAIDARAALKSIPPLIKGYLRLGAFVGDGAVVDRQFGTTDVLIIMPVEKIDPRYFEHFGAPTETKSRISADA